MNYRCAFCQWPMDDVPVYEYARRLDEHRFAHRSCFYQSEGVQESGSGRLHDRMYPECRGKGWHDMHDHGEFGQWGAYLLMAGQQWSDEQHDQMRAWHELPHA